MHSLSFPSHPGVFGEYNFSPATKIALISTLNDICFNCLGMMSYGVVYIQIIIFKFKVFIHHIRHSLKEMRKVMLLVHFVKLWVPFSIFSLFSLGGGFRTTTCATPARYITPRWYATLSCPYRNCRSNSFLFFI